MATEQTMKIVLDVPLSVGEALQQEARRQGTTPEHLALSDLQRLYRPMETISLPDWTKITQEERSARVLHYLEWARNQDPNTPHLTDEEISREAIYRRDDD